MGAALLGLVKCVAMDGAGVAKDGPTREEAGVEEGEVDQEGAWGRGEGRFVEDLRGLGEVRGLASRALPPVELDDWKEVVGDKGIE
jgi:hypothetical protein